MRTITQIAVQKHFLVAVCNDGTLWKNYGSGWIQLESIPQENFEAASGLTPALADADSVKL